MQCARTRCPASTSPARRSKSLKSGGDRGRTGMSMSTHLYPEIAAHLLRVTETGHWLEWQDWAYPILAEPFPLKHGHLLVPDKPGQGIEEIGGN